MKNRRWTNGRRGLLAAVMLLTGTVGAGAWETDSVRTTSPLSVSVSTHWGYLIPKGDHNKQVMQTHDVGYMDVRLQWKSKRDDIYERALHHPTVEVGLLLGDFTHVHLQGPQTPYRGQVGREVTLFGGLRYDFWRRGRWSAGMDIQNGIAYFTKRFDQNTNADNWLIGSALSVYISAGAYVQYQLSNDWQVSAGVDFKHVSNGTLARPNLGANTIGPSLTVARRIGGAHPLPRGGEPERYSHEQKVSDETPLLWRGAGPYLELSAGIAGSTLRDEFEAHHANHSPRYGSFIAMAAPMWRYHPVMASGVEVDYTYATYADHIGYYDEQDGHTGYDYSRHVLGVGLRHEFFYHHVSLHVGVGKYVYRHMGYTAEHSDGGSYQTVGLRYNFPRTGDRLFVGYNVKAHNFSKADCMQVHLGYRIF